MGIHQVLLVLLPMVVSFASTSANSSSTSKSDPMHILVTGAAGYIGSHTMLELVQSGYRVFGIDNFSNSVADKSGNPISLKRVGELTGRPIPFEKIDCRDAVALDRLFSKQKFDGVIHMAGWKHVGESTEKPFEYYQHNLVVNLNIIEMCIKYNVRNFIFSSSATVYGPPKRLPMVETDQTGVGITNPYGQTKFIMEKILLDIGKRYQDWNLILLRYFNPVGAHPSGRMGEDPLGVPNNLMPFVAQVAVGRLPVVSIFGTKWETPDGTGVRDYIHVVDLARGHISVLNYIQRKGHVGTDIFNLGTGRGHSVLEMVAALEKASGKTIPTKNAPPRAGDIASMYCDPSKAEKTFGWKAKFGLDEICRDLWNWQSHNPNGYLDSSEK